LSARGGGPGLTALRATASADLPGLASLFAERFGHTLTAEEWRWKYEQMPGEGRSWVAAETDGEVTAHAGALRLPARWQGGEGGVWQLVDFVAGRRGRGLRPPLVELGRRLLGDLPGEADAPWIFGFPSERHFRLGQRVFGYRALAAVEVLAGPLPPEQAPAGTPCESGDSCGAWAEEAWAACGTLGVRRSAGFLNWRYYARPGRYYRFYRLRSGQAGGLAVFAFVGAEAWAAELWLPPSGEWYASMLAVAADLRRSGLQTWRFWPLPVACEPLLPALGLLPTGERRFIGCRGRPGGPDPAAAAAGFYYAMGDYDSV
jgi:hypothetical protein